MVEKLVVGVCTFQRPIMLAACLESLAVQSIPNDMDVSLVVVDNESEPRHKRQVLDFAEKCPLPVRYVHRPRRGIACARNAILDEATRLGADWIAMLDDDETAAPDWISRLMAPEYRDTPVLMGNPIYIYPESLPAWFKRPPNRLEEDSEGQQQIVAHTNNVRFSTRLLDAGMRFNESLGLMGGEDLEFFTLAHLRGFEIRRTARAITYETAHPERLTFFGQIYRAYWFSVAETRRQKLLDPKRGGAFYRRCARDVASEVGCGVMTLLGSPLRLFQSRHKSKRRALAGARRLARAAGIVAGLALIPAQPYRNVVGE